MTRAVLFVCSGNIFRSLIAEHAFRHYVGTDALVSSAGVKVDRVCAYPVVIDALKARGVDVSAHRPRHFRETFAEHHYPVAMAKQHRDHMHQYHGTMAPLFRSLAYGEDLDVPDVGDVFADWTKESKETIERFVVGTVDLIFDGMPGLIARLPK